MTRFFLSAPCGKRLGKNFKNNPLLSRLFDFRLLFQLKPKIGSDRLPTRRRGARRKYFPCNFNVEICLENVTKLTLKKLCKTN